MKKLSKNSDVYILNVNDNKLTILANEQLNYKNSNLFRDVFNDILRYSDINEICIDFANQNNFDSYLIVFRNRVAEYCQTQSINFSTVNSNDDIESVISLMNKKPAELASPKDVKGVLFSYFEQIGNILIKIIDDIYNFVSFFGEVFQKLLKLSYKPGSMRWEDMPMHFSQSGVMALPITMMILFLLGLITGYQGALQLKQFGADSFIANLVGISLTRELSPLMVAILVAGRSGSAFAAEIGTMKVSEEIDALTTMGFDKVEFLVLPRVISVTLAMPFLVIICNIVGMTGGLIAAISTLDVTASGYIARMQEALTLWDIGTGIIKSIVFGFLISSLGCYKGLSVKGGADAVGKFTTSSVVAGVFLIILADAVFTFIFQSLGV